MNDSLMCFMPLLCMIIGVCSIIWPRVMWYLSEGWKFKNVEPSDLALTMTRVGGVLMVILGIFLLVRL